MPRVFRLSLAVLVLTVAGSLLLAPPRPASAHSGVPGLVYTLDAVRPGLPPGVFVQVQSGLAEQLVAANPTDQPFDVLADEGEPFLRISRQGVYGNLASADWWTSSSPSGVLQVPDSVQRNPHPKVPRWVRIGSGTSWGWFDHRLHPTAETLPDAVVQRGQPARLRGWSIPVRYGTQQLHLDGSVNYRPLLGSFVVAADPGPAGITATPLQGRLPGLFLQVPAGLRLTVLGRDGEPFARFTGNAVQLNQHSRTYVEDRTAQGTPTGAPSGTPQWGPPTSGTTLTWLDQRLQFPSELPPDRFVHAAAPAVVGDWSIPVQLPDGQQRLRGTISWQPAPGAAAPAATTAAAARTSPSRWPLALLALLAVPVAWIVLRSRRATLHRLHN